MGGHAARRPHADVPRHPSLPCGPTRPTRSRRGRSPRSPTRPQGRLLLHLEGGGGLKTLAAKGAGSPAPGLAPEGKPSPSSPSPPHTCGGEGRGEAAFHSLIRTSMSQPLLHAFIRSE